MSIYLLSLINLLVPIVGSHVKGQHVLVGKHESPQLVACVHIR